MLRVGMIGWRGMVGSVLMQRMREEKDFSGIEPVFFSTSNAGGAAPAEAGDGGTLKDASDLRELARCEVLISCQGGEYTTEVYAPLRKSGWKGYWIDAASTLRMSDEAVIILDPVNAELIREGLAKGLRAYAGGNCTVSLMLMAVCGLFQRGPGRVDDHDDVSGGFRGGRGEDAGTGEADGRAYGRDARRVLRKMRWRWTA